MKKAIVFGFGLSLGMFLFQLLLGLLVSVASGLQIMGLI